MCTIQILQEQDRSEWHKKRLLLKHLYFFLYWLPTLQELTICKYMQISMHFRVWPTIQFVVLARL